MPGHNDIQFINHFPVSKKVWYNKKAYCLESHPTFLPETQDRVLKLSCPCICFNFSIVCCPPSSKVLVSPRAAKVRKFEYIKLIHFNWVSIKGL